MVHQIILAFLHALRRRKVHPILLADILNLFPSACQAYDCGVEFGEVCREHAWCVPRWVAGYEQREERWQRGGICGGE